MPSTHISDARGLTHTGGTGLHISSDVKISGNTTFLGNVCGITADVSSRSASLQGPNSITNYDCSGNVRYFRHTDPPTSNWRANFTGLSLQRGQGATIKIAIVTSENIECYLEDVLVDEKTVSSFFTSSINGIKIKKGGKHGIITFDIVKNDNDEIHIYADISQDLVV